VFMGMCFYLLWNFSKPFLLALSILYVGSGIVVRLGGLLKRAGRPPQMQKPEHRAGSPS